MHRRRVEAQAYRRDDGLWDIEVRLHDSKALDTQDFRRGRIPADGPIHDMWLRVTIDEGFIVRAVESSRDAAPFGPCAGSRDEFSALVDAPMGKGWHLRVRDGFGGRKSCSHLAALFESIVTTAYQASCGGPDPRGEDSLMEAGGSRGCWPLSVVHANARSLPR